MPALRAGLPGRRADRLRPAGRCSCSPAPAAWSSRPAGGSRWSSCGRPASRPYIGGSTDNSVLELVFGYNGLGRLTGADGNGGGGGGGGGGGTGLRRRDRADAAVRRRDGLEISWLLPAALVALVALVVADAGAAPRTDRAARRARSSGAAGCWSPALVFSFMQRHHPPLLHGRAGRRHRGARRDRRAQAVGPRAMVARPRALMAMVSLTHGGYGVQVLRQQRDEPVARAGARRCGRACWRSAACWPRRCRRTPRGSGAATALVVAVAWPLPTGPSFGVRTAAHRSHRAASPTPWPRAPGRGFGGAPDGGPGGGAGGPG